MTTLKNPSLPALFYTVVCVGDSHLHTPVLSGTKYVKSITGKPFAGEFERMVSVLLMAFGVEDLRAPLSEDWLSFTCRPLTDGAFVCSTDYFLF